jgi:hypothetical protein
LVKLTRYAWIAAPFILCLLVGLIAVSVNVNKPVTYRVQPEQKLQVIKGIGFEIQSDSISSGNQGLPENCVAVPHDLTLADRQRLYDEMFKGFRYCRLAGGLYWRGLDAERRQLQPRWPEQLQELREMMRSAGIEGLSFEYWSPSPYWKANNSFVTTDSGDRYNMLRCFGPDFAKDTVYRGDVDRFLADFAQAVVTDIKTLEAAGLKVSMWGLQNEPSVTGGGYSKCAYPKSGDYVRAYQAVAGAVRRHDPQILLFADTESSFPSKIAPGMKNAAVAAVVDSYAVHTIGAPSENVRQVHAKIQKALPPRPWFQNEYEYLQGGATPERCLNTVQHIMDSFQLAENPTWFWLHALKPLKNAEASGYSLGFWKSLEDTNVLPMADSIPRWRDGPEFRELPDQFKQIEMILPARGDERKPGAGYSFSVNQTVTLYLLVNRRGDYVPAGWERTDLVTRWDDQIDLVYKRRLKAGEVKIPPHAGQTSGKHGAPHAVFIEPSDAKTFKVEIGVNAPIVIRSEYRALERAAAGMKPGSWIYNPYNWNAVGSFVKRMPWDCIALKVEETSYNKDARIFAYQKPDGKRTIVVSNRMGGPWSFRVETGIPGATWKGYRYTPQEAGEATMGLPVGTLQGEPLNPTLPHLSWEFWEEQ